MMRVFLFDTALAWLRAQPSACADALVTDLSGASSGVRAAWVAGLAQVLAEARRVLTPGAAGWVSALPQRSHWTATACEEAGFEVRDVLTHVRPDAAEHWILMRAPGPLRALRIDECRVGITKSVPRTPPSAENLTYGARPQGAYSGDSDGYNPNLGRFPANFALSHAPGCKRQGKKRVKGGGGPTSVVSASARGGAATNLVLGQESRKSGYVCTTHRDPDGLEIIEDWSCAPGCPVRMLGAQSGKSTSRVGKPRSAAAGAGWGMRNTGAEYADAGTAARFFHCYPAASAAVLLRQHLCRLVTPPRGLVLDPFPHSGTTAAAARAEGLRVTGPDLSHDRQQR